MHSVATSSALRSGSRDLGVIESSWDDLAIDLNLVCTPQLFIQRPKMTTGGQRRATLILYTLRSYTQRLLHQNDMPPFIHPYSIFATEGSETRIGSLNTCTSLLHVLHCGVPGSPALFWRNVQCECERLRNEALSMNKWELLAALQALAIYIIERLNTDGTGYETLDALLIRTVTDLAQQCSTIDINVDLNPERLWCDWIFNESTHRLCIVYRVIDMLVHFEPATMCPFYNTSLVLAPLPAKKQLWKADNAGVWHRERELGASAHTSFALFASGELVNMTQAPSRVRDWRRDEELLNAQSQAESTANWNEWCLGMDEFGSLVMLVASFIEMRSPIT
ncbi:unnamed protein product [Clonostachys rosea f. rosea IK726]|uniref:Uncharacterized protein n=1 Tax=Clonostachys rosea f. rosea IK726 TaxID=1349383 RepID=A0ACA9UXD5_BIOOC|nr:unnamed protein product [Clonostachys rosea f. rosea IK726]